MTLARPPMGKVLSVAPMSGRTALIDAAVQQAATAWAVITPRERVLQNWLLALSDPQDEQHYNVAEWIVPTIQANFYAESERTVTTPRVSLPVAARHGGLPNAE